MRRVRLPTSLRGPVGVLALAALVVVTGVVPVAEVAEVAAAVGGGRARNAPGADVAGEIVPVPDPLRGRRIVLMGDSLIEALAGALVAGAPNAVSGDGRSGCGWTSAVVVNTPNPSLSRACLDDREAYLDGVTGAARNADAVVLLSSWENNDHYVGGGVLRFGTPAWDAWLLAELEALRVRLGAPLVLTTVPLGGPAYRTSTGEFVYTQDEVDQARLDHIALLYRIFAAQHSADVSVVDLNRIVCPERYPCPGRLDGVVLRPSDGGHFDAAGSAWVAPRYLRAIGDTLAAQVWLSLP